VQPFHYAKAAHERDALGLAGAPGSRWLAGGTNLVDLMRLDVETPRQVVDINGLDLGTIREKGGLLHVGALVRNSDLAYHPTVQKRLPVLSQALLSGASPQLRNMATVGGNLMQRTRCAYFRDVASPCNKRQPGQGCGAKEGYNRMHAIFGASEHCIAVHPSDLCIALAALDVSVHVRGPRGERVIPFGELHTLPGDHPERDTVLAADELITEISVRLSPLAARSSYVKVRDRSSFAFALVSVAAAIEVRSGRIEEARVALGGVAHRPWRSTAAEAALKGAPLGEETIRRAAQAAVEGAVAQKHNAFKITLAQRTVRRALEELTAEVNR
jgi:xanthine dehydrogenase YagS FAD-binding subunit